MFNFLKKKLKEVVDSFTKKAEEEIAQPAAFPEPAISEKKELPTPEKAVEAVTAASEAATEGKKAEAAPELKKISSIEEKQVIEKKERLAEAKLNIPEKPQHLEPKNASGLATDISDSAIGSAPKSDFKSNLEEIRADLLRKAEEIKLEEAKPKGVLGKVAGMFRKKDYPAQEEKKGILEKITSAVTTTKISGSKFDELFEELELTLLENNVAVEVIDQIKSDLKSSLTEKTISRGKVGQAVSSSLKKSIEGLFDVEKIDFVQKVKEKKPFIIVFAGINGSGKTTTIAKIASMLKKNNLKAVMAAADTFRAAAIQQLQEHADNLGIKLIKHDYGSDPAAVAFDAIKYAQSKDIDVVLIDTAGRQHSNTNLMDEMKKVVRVAKPDLKIFVGESITGNDCVEQAKHFNDAIGIDGIILAKADVDEKGGAAISVSYVTRKPIIYLGTGQGYDDLTPFRPELIVESLGLATS